MNREKKKKDPGILFLDMIIVVMIFVMIAAGYRLFFSWSIAKERSTFMQDAGRMAFDLERHDYASLIEGRYFNEFNGYKAEGYHALADYVHAASMYKVYAAKGYTDKADRQKEIMDRSRKEMGELTIFADEVDEMFRLQ